MTKRSKQARIETILQGLWATAAAAGDMERLMVLRAAFEAHALQLGEEPILVAKLTANQVATIEDCFPENSPVLASGSTWALFPNQSEVQDVLDQEDYLVDELVMRAMGNNIDMTEAQEAFTTRAATNSVTNMCRKLRKAVPR